MDTQIPAFRRPATPQIGFLQEALRWWDRWLKGIETGVENDPAMRLYVMDGLPPQTWYAERPGRWIAEEVWPSPDIAPQTLHLTGGGELQAAMPASFHTSFSSPADCGAAAGEYCAIWLGPEMPGDQSGDDAMSLCFDGGVQPEALDIVGAPIVRLRLMCDKPKAQIAVRLCDVDESGASSRITYGVLNLCHRDSHEFPELLEPGRAYDVSLQLDDIAYRLPKGHRLRLSISNAYWPMVWPSPERTRLTLLSGSIDIPRRAALDDGAVAFETPEAAAPWRIEELRKPSNKRGFSADPTSGEAVLTIVDDFGLARDLEHGLETGGTARETWRIHPDDPLSARGRGPLDADAGARRLAGPHRDLCVHVVRRGSVSSDGACRGV